MLMKLYEHIQGGGSMQDFICRPSRKKPPKEDIDSLMVRTADSLMEFFEVFFGDPNIMNVDHIISICDSLRKHRDVEIKTGREGIQIVELYRKKKEMPDRVSGGRPGAVYRPAGRPPGQVNNMTVR